jgi:hypothetical protein
MGKGEKGLEVKRKEREGERRGVKKGLVEGSLWRGGKRGKGSGRRSGHEEPDSATKPIIISVTGGPGKYLVPAAGPGRGLPTRGRTLPNQQALEGGYPPRSRTRVIGL